MDIPTFFAEAAERETQLTRKPPPGGEGFPVVGKNLE